MLFTHASEALDQADVDGRLRKCAPQLVHAIRTSNSDLQFLELFLSAACLSSAKLPRYLSALQLHASLVEKLHVDDVEISDVQLAIDALQAQLDLFGVVKSDARDMAAQLHG